MSRRINPESPFSSKTRKVSQTVYNLHSKTRKSNNNYLQQEIVVDNVFMDNMFDDVINNRVKEYDRKIKLLNIKKQIKLYGHVNSRNENLFVLFCKKFMFKHANDILNLLKTHGSNKEIKNIITKQTIYNETAYIYSRFYIYLTKIDKVSNYDNMLEASDIIRYMDDNTNDLYRHIILQLPQDFELYDIGDITEEIKNILTGFGNVSAYDILGISEDIPRREDRFINDYDVKLDFHFSDEEEQKEELGDEEYGERLDKVVEQKNRPSRFRNMFNRLFSRKVGVMGGRRIYGRRHHRSRRGVVVRRR